MGVSAYLSLTGRRRRGRLFEAERLLTFSAFRMSAYSKWAQIRGWAIIRINTVRRHACIFHGFFLEGRWLFVLVNKNRILRGKFILLCLVLASFCASEGSIKIKEGG